MYVAVDFDGTIVEHEFPAIGRPLPGAFDWLKRWQAAGAKLILWTMRSDGRSGTGRENGPVLTEAVEFCRANGVAFFAVNGNPTQRAWTASPKCYAHVYVDDAAAGCPLRPASRPWVRPGVDWAAVGPFVLAMIEAKVGTPPVLDPPPPAPEAEADCPYQNVHAADCDCGGEGGAR